MAEKASIRKQVRIESNATQNGSFTSAFASTKVVNGGQTAPIAINFQQFVRTLAQFRCHYADRPELMENIATFTHLFHNKLTLDSLDLTIFSLPLLDPLTFCKSCKWGSHRTHSDSCLAAWSSIHTMQKASPLTVSCIFCPIAMHSFDQEQVIGLRGGADEKSTFKAKGDTITVLPRSQEDSSIPTQLHLSECASSQLGISQYCGNSQFEEMRSIPNQFALGLRPYVPLTDVDVSEIGNHPAFMTDAEFDNLSTWSDVSKLSKYNMPLKSRRSLSPNDSSTVPISNCDSSAQAAPVNRLWKTRFRQRYWTAISPCQWLRSRNMKSLATHNTAVLPTIDPKTSPAHRLHHSKFHEEFSIDGPKMYMYHPDPGHRRTIGIKYSWQDVLDNQNLSSGAMSQHRSLGAKIEREEESTTLSLCSAEVYHIARVEVQLCCCTIL